MSTTKNSQIILNIDYNRLFKNANIEKDPKIREFLLKMILLYSKTNYKVKLKIYEKLSDIYLEKNNKLSLINLSFTVLDLYIDHKEETEINEVVTLIEIFNSTAQLLFEDDYNIILSLYLYYQVILLIKEHSDELSEFKKAKVKIMKKYKKVLKKLSEELEQIKMDYYDILNENQSEYEKEPKEKLYTLVNSLLQVNFLSNEKEKEEKKEDLKDSVDKNENNNKEENISDDKNKNDIKPFYLISKNWLIIYYKFLKLLKKIENEVGDYKNFLIGGFEVELFFKNFIITNNNNITSDFLEKEDIYNYIGPINNFWLLSTKEDFYFNNNIDLSYTNVYLDNKIKENVDYIILNEDEWFSISKVFSCINEIKRYKINNEYEVFLKKFRIFIFDDNLKNNYPNLMIDKYIQISHYLTLKDLIDNLQNIFNEKEGLNNIFNLENKNFNIFYTSSTINKNIDNNVNVDNSSNKLFELLIAYINNIKNYHFKCTKIDLETQINKTINELFDYNEETILLITTINENNDESDFIYPITLNSTDKFCSFCKKKLVNDKDILFCDEENCDHLNEYIYCNEECKNNDKNHIAYHQILKEKYISQKIYISDLNKLNINRLVTDNDSLYGKVGLYNLGNTCFMNSALQCLSNCENLTKLFLSKKYEQEINYENNNGTKGAVAKAYYNLIEKLWNSNEPLDISNFRTIFVHFARQFSSFNQQDSNEFLTFVLDKLHEDLNRISVKPYIEMKNQEDYETDIDASNRFWKNFLMRDNSIIVDLFYGQYKSRIICPDCNKISITYEPFMFLSLPIPTGRFSIKFKYFQLNSLFPNEYDIFISKKLTCEEFKNKIVNEVKNKYLTKNNVELILLSYDSFNNKKIITKIFKENEFLFDYINQNNNEICAYEKESNNNIENNNNSVNNNNVYCYLCNYKMINSFFGLIPNVKIDYLSKYPIAISINENDKVDDIYKKISINIFKKNNIKLSSSKNNNYYSRLEETKLLKSGYTSNITKESEDKYIQFKIHLTHCNYMQKFCDFCGITLLKNKSNHTCRFLDRFSHNEAFKYIRSCIENQKYPLILNIELFNDINELRKTIKLNHLSNNAENKQIKKHSIISLYDCLSLFCSEEKLEQDNAWYCNRCKEHKEAFKKMDIFKLPYYLIIQLKRFKRDDDMGYGHTSFFNIFSGGSKNESLIDFPINDLDLRNYILENNNTNSNINNNNSSTNYELFAVCQHYGGISFGHYTAVCKNDNQWYKFNDSNVHKISNDKEIVNEAAYILFYKKK